jgi:hypothetical protein
MPREIFFTISPLGRFHPNDARSAELYDELPKGKVMRATVTQPRNVDHHRKFFALLGAVWPHQDMYPTTEALLDGIKLALGHVQEARNAETLELVMVPASINFGSMDQATFEQFYEKAVDLICTRIIPGLNNNDLDREVENILEGRR